MVVRKKQQVRNCRHASRIFGILVVLPFFFLLQAAAQSTGSLPRSTPEAEGISSEGILDFLEAAGKSKHEFHSFMILRHGKVVAEGWWKPYRTALRHTMYSVSKSFTATAVGFAVAEKKLSVEDKVVSFFPDELPDSVNQNLAKLRVRDLLSMSAGQEPDPTSKVNATQNWVKAFLSTPILHEPGTKFLYNSAATYMLSAIVQKVTGQPVLAYLQPRLFAPLGIDGIDWESDPAGINVGGWGLRLKTEDMAKFGQLFLQKGKWKDKQILPAAWIEEASTQKIEQEPQAPQARKDSSDWLQGYAYQMWRSRNRSYRGDGAFGQFIIVLPEKDAVIAITAETSDMQGEFNLVWQHLLPAFREGTLPVDAAAQQRLQQKINSLALPLPPTNHLKLEITVSGKRFSIEPGKKLEAVQLDFKDSVCHVRLYTDSANHDLYFAQGRWQEGETTKKGPYLVAGAANNRVGLSPFKVLGAYTWKDEKTLDLVLRYIESPHTETIRCSFEGDSLTMEFLNSFNPSIRTMYKGVVQKNKSGAARKIKVRNGNIISLVPMQKGRMPWAETKLRIQRMKSPPAEVYVQHSE